MPAELDHPESRARAFERPPVRADTDVYLNFGPPAVRYEDMPSERAASICPSRS